MPSLRVLSVVVLVGLGATAGGLADDPGSDGLSQHQVAASASTPASTGARGARSASGNGFDVRAENARPGARDWRISRAAGTGAGLAAYAGAVSVRPGERVPLHVSGRGAVRSRAYRIGWYGGAGARQVWTGSLTATPGATDPATWPVAGSVDTTGWPPGDYLFRLDLGAASRYVPLTVRSPQVEGQLLLVTSPLNWQAENGPVSPSSSSSLVRSFDRPYAQGYGAGGFLADDASIVQLAERDGTRLAYLTDHDLATTPALLDGATAVAFGSASQYWTAPLRTAMIAAIHAGTNAAFFGSGTGTRRLTLGAGGRTMTLQQSIPPPTAALTGLRPVCSSSGTASGTASGAADGSDPGQTWVVQDPGWWGYRQAGVSAGQQLDGLVSAAPDGGATGTGAGAGTTGAASVQVLAKSPVTCRAGGASSGPQQAVYWGDASGAAVFSTGTSRWACVAGGSCPGQSTDPVPAGTRTVAAQVTRAVLTAFANPAAVRANPVS